MIPLATWLALCIFGGTIGFLNIAAIFVFLNSDNRSLKVLGAFFISIVALIDLYVLSMIFKW